MKREYWGDEIKEDGEDGIEKVSSQYVESDSSEDEAEDARSDVGVNEEESESDEEFQQFKKAKIEEIFGEEVASEAFKMDDAIKDALEEGGSDSEESNVGLVDIDESEMEKARIAEDKRVAETVPSVDELGDDALLWSIKSIWKVMEGRRNNDETVQQTLQRLNLKRKNTMKRKERKRNQQQASTVTKRDPESIIDLKEASLDEQIATVVDAVDLLEKDSDFEDIMNWTRNEVFESRGFVKSYDRKGDSLW